MKPFAIGAAMAAMMIWMLHERIMSGNLDLTSSGITFVLAHVGVVVAIGTLSLFVPSVRKTALQHRPSLGHAARMGIGMVAMAGSIHLAMHGALI